MPAHPMDDIPVRPLRFAVEDIEGADPLWSRSSPDFARFINALGVHVPWFERFLVATMRAYRDQLSDEQLKADVQAIIGQEAHHAFNFLKWNAVLDQHYPGIAALDAAAKAYFEAAGQRDQRFRIGFMAGYETFTFLGGMIILDRYEELMGDADPVLRALWIWHQVEEVEHGAVAFDVYKAFHGEDEWYRRWMVAHAFGHIAWQTLLAYRLMLRGVPLRRRLRAWRFFTGFAWDLFRSSWPVYRRTYHPRHHPICNDAQNRVAVAWRARASAGEPVERLDNAAIDHMLRTAAEGATP